jgi:hypothetical protein
MGRGTRGARTAAEVRAELARQRLTIQWLADHTTLNLRTLNRRLNEQGRAFDLDELREIADALEVPLTQLLDWPPVAASAS